MIENPRGSIWRKWDLQVHTPYSHLNNQFGSEFPEYFQTLLEKAEEAKVWGIGITDYFTIDGYKSARALLSDPHFLGGLSEKVRVHASRILLLPNIELRTNFLIKTKSGESRVNMHVIFSDEVTPEDIEEQFLREIKFWDLAEPQQTSERRSLTTTNLIELGKRLKTQQEEFKDKTDIFVGMMNAVVDANEVTHVLAGNRAKFHLKYLIAFPSDEDLTQASWSGQGHQSRKLCIQMADMLFSSNENTRKFALGQLHPSPEAFVEEFKSIKPCLHSSDAHSPEELFAQPLQRHTWIKADVTFEGLRQVLHEPEYRVFIGDEPDHRKQVKIKPTRYIDTLNISVTGTLADGDTWFKPETIPINSGLVAIIGKKGSGKSAFSDILGLLGNSTQKAFFSFLRPNRFWLGDKKRARAFSAILTWHDKAQSKMKLSDEVDPNQPETVKYIPQSYLEQICNDIEQGIDSDFQKELRQVIFSHIRNEDRLETTSLIDLLKKKSEASGERLKIHKSRCQQLTREIIDLETKNSADSLARMKAELETKNRELTAHMESKPPPVPEEATDPEAEANKTIRQKLQAENEKFAVLEKEHAECLSGKAALILKVAAATNLLDTLGNAKLDFQPTLDRVLEKATNLGLDGSTLLVLTINSEPVEKVRDQAQLQIKELEGKLDEGAEGSLAQRLAASKAAVEAIKKQLDEPEQKRQAAIRALADWEKKKGELIGSKEVAGSIKQLEDALEQHNKLPAAILALRAQRLEEALKIYDCISELASEYRSVFEPVARYYDSKKILPSDVNLGFAVTMAMPKFASDFVAHIDQSKKGSFRGSEEGLKAAKGLVEKADLESRDGVQKFLTSVLEALERHAKANPPVKIADQLKREVTLLQFLDFLFNLDYLRPKFELQWDGKPPELLSPGERGSLLLIFYLLIDLRETPLVIDQPEENLDNETIYRVLVPCIKHAKQRRQLIIVTHNPNLAVVSDADQIIYANIDKKNGNELTYECGAIENPKMKEHILDVLEGTEPAFKKREERYQAVR